MTNQAIRIVPTQGCFQLPLSATLVRETATLWIVKVEGQMAEWKFSKKDKLRTGSYKYDFPGHMIDILTSERVDVMGEESRAMNTIPENMKSLGMGLVSMFGCNPVVAKKLIDLRDCLRNKDLDAAHAILYDIANPLSLVKEQTEDTHDWSHFESLAEVANS